jgi:hypothetical protein
MDNFTPLRNGILEHLRDGKLCIFDFAIYVCMIMRSNWATGIYHGCAGTIAYQCGEPNSKPKINKTLIRLRSDGYINYRKGDGKRGGYPILINKCDIRIGELAGTRLDAWENGELAVPKYKPQNGNGTVPTVRPIAKATHKKASTPAPENFTPDEKNIATARKLGLDLAVIVPKFLANHESKGNTFKNWNRALDAWMLREREFSKPNGHAQPNPAGPDLWEQSRKAGIVP